MEQGFLLPTAHVRGPRDSGAPPGLSALSPGAPLAPWVSAPPPSPLHLAAASMGGGSGGLYAGKKRKKPAIRSPKMDVAAPKKTNPSKRHRDRLNAEMERLAGMLPFPADVISKLDKLSILRLSVSFLRTKSFFTAAVNRKRHLSNGIAGYGAMGNHADLPTAFPEGEMLLQALHGFVLVVTADGSVFYTSHTIQEYLGFHQCDVVHQSVYELIHTEDRYEFSRQLHWALNPPSASDARAGDQEGRSVLEHGIGTVATFHPQQLPPENSSFLERQFMCRFRCLLDNSSGFLALLIQGRLKLLHGQNQRGHDGSQMPPQLALFGVATPLQPPSILEIRTRNTIFRTKHKLDFTPTGCDAKGRIVLGYSEMELCMRGTGYQFIHAGDMLYCADNHMRMMKTGESGFTIFRLLTKDNSWAWVQANARLVYKGNRPDYIIATQRPLSNEEGEEHLRKRATQFPFTFTTGEAMLYDVDVFQPPMQGPGGPGGGGGGHGGTERAAAPACEAGQVAKGAGGRTSGPVDPGSLMAALMLQDKSVYLRTAASGEERLPSYTFNDAAWLASGGRGDDVDRCLSRIKLEENDGRPAADLTANIGDELTDILDTLGVNVNDIELVEEERQLIMGDMEMSPHLGSILSNDDIISFVEDLLKQPDCCMVAGHGAAAAQQVNENAGATAQDSAGPQLRFASPFVPQVSDLFGVGHRAAQSCAQAAASEGRDARDDFLARDSFNGGNVGAAVALQGACDFPAAGAALGLTARGTPAGGAAQGAPAKWNVSLVPSQGAALARSAGYVDNHLPLSSKLQNWSPTAAAAAAAAAAFHQRCGASAASARDREQMHCAAGPGLGNSAHGRGAMARRGGAPAGLPSFGYAGGVADFVAEPVASFQAPRPGLNSDGSTQNGQPGHGWPARARQRATSAGDGGGAWSAAPAPPYSPAQAEGAQPPRYSDCVRQMHAAPLCAGVPGHHPDAGLFAHFHHQQQQQQQQQQQALAQPVSLTFDLRSDLTPFHPNDLKGHDGFPGPTEGLSSFSDILRTGHYS